MDNSKILSSILHHIKVEMQRRHLSQQKLADLCTEIGKKVSQGTISNMFNQPSSARLSSILNVCEALDLNLFAIFREIDNDISTNPESNLIYNINHPAFQGYLSPMYIYYIETSSTNSKRLLKGELSVGDFYHTNECIAHLRIDTKEVDDDGKTKYKDYYGNVVINRNTSIFFHLASNRLGDEWSLIFNHGNLNQNTLACSLGTAVTLSSGKSTRYPTMHFVCLSKQELSAEKEKIIANRLLVHNQNIVISESKLNEFLSLEDLEPVFKDNVLHCINRDVAKSYIIPLSSVTQYVSDQKVLYQMIVKLLEYSACESSYRIPPDEDTKLFTMLK